MEVLTYGLNFRSNIPHGFKSMMS